MRLWSGHRSGELTTLPKTPSWMSGFVPGRGRWGIKDRRESTRWEGEEGGRGEMVRAQPPRGGTGGEVKEWVGGRLKDEGEGMEEQGQGRPSNGE